MVYLFDTLEPSKITFQKVLPNTDLTSQKNNTEAFNISLFEAQFQIS